MTSNSDQPDSDGGDAGEGRNSSPQDPQPSQSNSETVEELFNRMEKDLIGFVMGFGMTPSEAEEIVAEAFEKVISREDPQPVGNLGGYLYRTAKNLAINRRVERAVRERSAPLIQAQAGNEVLLPEQILIEAQEEELLLHAFEELRPRVRMAIRLRMWDGLTDQQIVGRFAAVDIAIGERTVRRYLAEGLKVLKQKIHAANFPPEGNNK
jgi:RNA polymerase sigma-70 factor (ECF subfamily)